MNIAATCALLDWGYLAEGEDPALVTAWIGAPDVIVQPMVDRVLVDVRSSRVAYTVTVPTFDVAALLEVRGTQALDVGECEACAKWLGVAPGERPLGPCPQGCAFGRRKVSRPCSWGRRARVAGVR